MVAKVSFEFDTGDELSHWLDGLFGGLATNIREEIAEMNQDVQTVIEQLRAAAQQNTDVKSSLENFIGTLPALIQQAVADAQASGVDAAQLASLRELADGFATNGAAMAADILNAPHPAPAPEPAPVPEPNPAPDAGTEPTPAPAPDTNGGV